MLLAARSKTRLAASDVEVAIKKVVLASYGVTRLMPVIVGAEIVAWAGWSYLHDGCYVWEHKPWMKKWADKNGCFLGYANVDDLINQSSTNGQMKQCFFFKNPSLTGTFGSVSWAHFYNLVGWPAGGLMNGTAYTARRHDDTEVGAIMHGGNVSPASKYLISGTSRTDGNTNSGYVYVLYDMVLSYDQCVNAGATTLTNTLAPLRYVGGSDPGLQIMSSNSTALANSTAFTSIKYTSITGSIPQGISTVGPTLTTPNGPTLPDGGTPAESAFTYVNSNTRNILTAALRNGDSGIKQLDSYTTGTSNTDAVNFILGFPLGWYPGHTGNEYTYPWDFKSIASLPQVKDGACLTFAAYHGISGSLSTQQTFNVAWV